MNTNPPSNSCAFSGFPMVAQASAQFYTSTPRPYAKTSLGFYPEQPVFDDLTDDEEETETESESATDENSGSSTPPTSLEDDQGSSQQQQVADNGMLSQPQIAELPSQPAMNLAMPAPRFQLPPSSPQPQPPQSLASVHLDQHTLKQLMVNPELLRQLNEAANQLMATRISAQPPPPPQPMVPQAAFGVQRPLAMPPPSPSGAFYPFGYPYPSPMASPICGAPSRPTITSVTSSQSQSMPMVTSQRPASVAIGYIDASMMPPPRPVVRAANGKMCLICGEDRAGMHYGVMSCFACMDFFRRRVSNAWSGRAERRNLKECYNRTRQCVVTKETRNVCKFCRFQKCLEVGMREDMVRIANPNRAAVASDESRRCQSALPPVI